MSASASSFPPSTLRHTYISPLGFDTDLTTVLPSLEYNLLHSPGKSRAPEAVCGG